MPVTSTWIHPSIFDGLFHFHWHKFSATIPSEPEGVAQFSLSEPLGPAFAFPRGKMTSKWCTFQRWGLDHVGGHSSGGASTGGVPCREGFHRPRKAYLIHVLMCTWGNGFPNSNNLEWLSFLSWPNHVGSHSSGGTLTGRAPRREGPHRRRMGFVSIVAPSCRRPLQQWNLDRQGTLSGGIPSPTNDLRFHRGPIMSEAIPAVELRPAGYPGGKDSIVHE